MTTIYVKRDYFFLDTEYRQPSIHQHFAKHIILSVTTDLVVTFSENQNVYCKGIIIDSNISHTVANQDNRMLVFLIDDTSILARNIDKSLSEKSFVIIEDSIVKEIQQLYHAYLVNNVDNSYTKFFNFVFRQLKIDCQNIAITDKRIQWSLSYILEIDTIDSTIISDMCTKVELSKSRFSHLFKEQTGVSLNSYLALSKLRKAYQVLLKSGDITVSAMNAGFSSPSHFSASSQKFLGISASELIGNCKIFSD